MEDDINSLRQKIDGIDDQILSLLEKRTELALKVAKTKGSVRQDMNREVAVVRRLCASAADSPLDDEAIGVIWRCIFEYSRQAQARSVDTIKS